MDRFGISDAGWKTVRFALGSWARTVRLVLILIPIVAALASPLLAVVVLASTTGH